MSNFHKKGGKSGNIRHSKSEKNKRLLSSHCKMGTKYRLHMSKRSLDIASARKCYGADAQDETNMLFQLLGCWSHKIL